MKKYVECYGSMMQLEILPKDDLMRCNVRYVGTDFDANVDIYEDRETGALIGCTC
jgi:hypothetical protein